MWLSEIWPTQWLAIHLIPSYFRCKICKLFHFYVLFTYSLIAGKIKCNVSGKIFHDSVIQQCQIPGSFGSTIASDGCVMKQQHTNLKLQICTLQHLRLL